MLIENFNFDATLIIAQQRATLMVANDLYSRFGLSHQARINKALLGCMGELAFEHWLKTKQYDYKVDNENFKDRNSDEYDFLIGNKKLDIKVAKKSTPAAPSDNWTYGYPQEQNPASKDYAVVGWVDFSKKEVGFYGWITGAAISEYAVVTKNSFKGYNYLTPNHEFKWGAMNKNFDTLFQHIFNR